MLQTVFRMKYQGIPVKPSSIEVDTSNIWRSVYEHGDWDISLNGLPPKKNIDKTINGLLYLYKTVRSYLKFLKIKLRLKLLKLQFQHLVLIRIQLQRQTKKEAKSLLWLFQEVLIHSKRAVAIQMTKSLKLTTVTGGMVQVTRQHLTL